MLGNIHIVLKWRFASREDAGEKKKKLFKGRARKASSASRRTIEKKSVRRRREKKTRGFVVLLGNHPFKGESVVLQPCSSA